MKKIIAAALAASLSLLSTQTAPAYAGQRTIIIEKRTVITRQTVRTVRKQHHHVHRNRGDKDAAAAGIALGIFGLALGIGIANMNRDIERRRAAPGYYPPAPAPELHCPWYMHPGVDGYCHDN